MKLEIKILSLFIMLSVFTACTDYLDEFNGDYENLFSYGDFDQVAPTGLGNQVTCKVKGNEYNLSVESWNPIYGWGNDSYNSEDGDPYYSSTLIYSSGFPLNRDSLCIAFSKESSSYMSGTFKCGKTGYTYSKKLNVSWAEYLGWANGQCNDFLQNYESILEDSRDSKLYRITKVGSQTWMAQNIDYRYIDHYCYGNDDAYCSAFGALYTWEDAQEACPSGWRLPNRGEAVALIDYIENQLGDEYGLRSKYFWRDNPGSDVVSFNAYPAGYVDENDKFAGLFTSAGFWLADTLLYFWLDDEKSPSLNALSVRCIKD